MATPLVMLGPGGDYTTRFDIRGTHLAKRTGAALGYQSDAESAGSFASWSRWAGRRRRKQEQMAAAIQRGVDCFEHTTAVTVCGTYTAAGRSDDQAAYGAVWAAARAWLSNQLQTLACEHQQVIVNVEALTLSKEARQRARRW